MLERALAELGELGLEGPEAVMSDNAFVYTKSRRSRALLAAIGARHIPIPPYTPRSNGKVERFIKAVLVAADRGFSLYATPSPVASGAPAPLRSRSWIRTARP